MGKVMVIYHSQQYGNTKILAGALADGAREAGAEVELINTNERRVTLNEFLSADAVALGTPDYFSYLAGTIKTFFDDIRALTRYTCFESWEALLRFMMRGLELKAPDTS